MVSAQDNAITVDIGPTFVGAAWTKVGEQMGDGVSTPGFGIAAQYERHITEEASLAGRIAYMGLSLGQKYDSGETYTMSMNSFAIEFHARYYPGASTFYLDGMLGYANLAIGFTGTMEVEQQNGTTKMETVSFSVPRSYLKVGAKIGWRIDFGEPGGFLFEPSFGYSFGIGITETLGKGLTKKLGVDMTDLGTAFGYLEDVIFIGGPRVSLAFGWRF